MTFETRKEGDALTVAIEGRLDTRTTPELEEGLNDMLDGVARLTFDFSKLDYISSSGLRLLLVCQKRMNKQGSMKVAGANETVMEIFEVTGFNGILELA